jgi:hypothetical protein
MSQGEKKPYEPGGDPLDELIRQALQRNTPAVQPSPRLWERIQSQVTAGPAPASHRPPAERLSRLMAPFVQGLAAAVLFVLVGVSLGTPRAITPGRVETVSPPPHPAATVPSIREASPASVQRLGRLAAVDTFNYEQAAIPAQKPLQPPEPAARAAPLSADLDADLVMTNRFVPGGVFP